MTGTAPTPARTIRARVHESAVGRITRIYASTLADIFTETLQNARRAGATRVRISLDRVACDSGEATVTVAIADDGAGIADPALLLSFGENGWDEELVRREDAAGFGFASLARRGCTVSSRPRSPDRRVLPSWKATLEPAHFLGEAEAAIHPGDDAPWPHGAAISFEAGGPGAESVLSVRKAAEAAALHYPLPVAFEDRTCGPAGCERLERRAFLDGAVHAERWRGLVLGVFRGRRRGYNDPDLNFHGHTLAIGLPAVETVHGSTWSARADIAACPDLELVLPARREAVETPFLEEMRAAARLAIYRAMADDPDPRPAFADWKSARDAGIELAPPPARLRPWRPESADVDDWREPPKPVDIESDSLVMEYDPEPPEAQALRCAFELRKIPYLVAEPDSRLAGYGWYDRIDRVTAIEIGATLDGRRYRLDEFPLPEPVTPGAAILPPRPAMIGFLVSIRASSGRKRTLELAGDLAFAGEAGSWPGCSWPLVPTGSTMQPQELADLLRAAFFSPSDDSGADSYETQRERFEQEALHFATRLLVSDEEACRASIAEAVRRDLTWLAPRGRTVDIRIARPDVTVTLGDAGEDPHREEI